jgi:hypothetical protein
MKFGLVGRTEESRTMMTLFILIMLTVSTVIYMTGAWHVESSRTHDLIAFLLLANVVWLLSLAFQPYVEPWPKIPCDCVVRTWA